MAKFAEAIVELELLNRNLNGSLLGFRGEGKQG